MLKLRYRIGSGEYHDVEETLFVPVGTTVDFQAVSQPPWIGWPAGKPIWRVNGDDAGTGETKSVDFLVRSNSTGDYKSVAAECGNEVVAHVIVYELAVKAVDEESDPPCCVALGGSVQLKAVVSHP